MPNTSNRGYPYPQLGDAPNVPAQIQALAAAVDTDVTALRGSVKFAAGNWLILTTSSNYGLGQSNFRYINATLNRPSGQTDNGWVNLRGVFRASAASAANAIICSPPAALVPDHDIPLPAAISPTAGPGNISVNAAGTITCSVALSAGEFVSFEGLRYPLVGAS